MERRQFLHIGAGTAGALFIPVFGNAIAAEDLLNPMAASAKKALADTAMNAATQGRRIVLRRAHRALPEPVRHHA